jgi:hypothetical protein
MFENYPLKQLESKLFNLREIGKYMKYLSAFLDKNPSISWEARARALRLQVCNLERWELLEEKVILAIKVKDNEYIGRRLIRVNCELRYWTAESAKVEEISSAGVGGNETFVSRILGEFSEDFDSGN